MNTLQFISNSFKPTFFSKHILVLIGIRPLILDLILVDINLPGQIDSVDYKNITIITYEKSIEDHRIANFSDEKVMYKGRCS